MCYYLCYYNIIILKLNLYAPKKRKNFCYFKTDSVQRGLIGNIVQKFEKIGLKIIGMKMLLASKEQALKHYNKDEAWLIEKGEKMLSLIENY